LWCRRLACRKFSRDGRTTTGMIRAWWRICCRTRKLRRVLNYRGARDLRLQRRQRPLLEQGGVSPAADLPAMEVQTIARQFACQHDLVGAERGPALFPRGQKGAIDAQGVLQVGQHLPHGLGQFRRRAQVQRPLPAVFSPRQAVIGPHLAALARAPRGHNRSLARHDRGPLPNGLSDAVQFGRDFAVGRGRLLVNRSRNLRNRPLGPIVGRGEAEQDPECVKVVHSRCHPFVVGRIASPL